MRTAISPRLAINSRLIMRVSSLSAETTNRVDAGPVVQRRGSLVHRQDPGRCRSRCGQRVIPVGREQLPGRLAWAHHVEGHGRSPPGASPPSPPPAAITRHHHPSWPVARCHRRPYRNAERRATRARPAIRDPHLRQAGHLSRPRQPRRTMPRQPGQSLSAKNPRIRGAATLNQALARILAPMCAQSHRMAPQTAHVPVWCSPAHRRGAGTQAGAATPRSQPSPAVRRVPAPALPLRVPAPGRLAAASVLPVRASVLPVRRFGAARCAVRRRGSALRRSGFGLPRSAAIRARAQRVRARAQRVGARAQVAGPQVRWPRAASGARARPGSPAGRGV